MDSTLIDPLPEPFWNCVERKTGIATSFKDEEILAQLLEEWGEFSEYLLQRRWKYVNHMGRANLMPFGSEGKSLGSIVVGLH